MDLPSEMSCKPLHAGFYESASGNPDALALDFGEYICTYGELRSLALRIAHGIECHLPSESDQKESPWVGLLVGKTKEGYASILGTSSAGHGYMPLSCEAPARRLAEMITRSRTGILVADANGIGVLEEVLSEIGRPMTIVVVANDASSNASISELANKFSDCRFVPLSADEKSAESIGTTVAANAPAYLLFTSGSTGRPKGVAVSHGNVRYFLGQMEHRYRFSNADRFSQNFDFTFDLSVFDIFMCFEAGACLCPPNQGDKILPKRYVIRSKLSVWFSVPSVVGAMSAARQLQAHVFPNLRYSLFCGEALTVGAARLWQEAAPNSELVNLYGPTEATICCTGFTFHQEPDSSGDECIVPIGTPFVGLQARLLDEHQLPVTDGTVGELWIGGQQVALGYWDDPGETNSRFVTDSDLGVRFYRTGDRVYRDVVSKDLCFVGRLDHQVKIRGYRIELGEVEQALRAGTGCMKVVAVAWPTTGLHNKLIAVVDAVQAGIPDAEQVLAQLRTRLPEYMIPDEIIYLKDIPLNDNGKIDRRATAGRLVEVMNRNVANNADGYETTPTA